MKIDGLILDARANKCSDIHISVGMPLMYRVNGRLMEIPVPYSDEDIEDMLVDMMDDKQLADIKAGKDVDFAVRTSDGNRQRVNIFRQQGRLAATIRLLNSTIPELSMLGLPPVLNTLAEKPRGLILVTGPTGSGKSTTLASIINKANENLTDHIITLEDPIEYIHHHNKAIVNQREVGMDTLSYANALRAALREDPDIILVGEMRDLETISTAITAAETGHLVFSTLHTIGAASTIDRIIDIFPTNQQQQVRVQLAMVLEGVISQSLLPIASGNGRVAAFEVMLASPAIRSLIREAKTHQIQSTIQTSRQQGMITMDDALYDLFSAGTITREMALTYAQDQQYLRKKINGQ